MSEKDAASRKVPATSDAIRSMTGTLMAERRRFDNAYGYAWLRDRGD
jgi:hypothetical protein